MMDIDTAFKEIYWMLEDSEFVPTPRYHRVREAIKIIEDELDYQSGKVREYERNNGGSD